MRKTFLVAIGLVACGAGASGTVGTFGPEPVDASSPSRDPDAGTSFDAASTAPVIPCKPLTCANQGIECGAAGNGCGGVIADCGKCAAGLRCGGPGAPSKCVSPFIGCEPKACGEQGVECGPARDGCGGLILDCGPCDGGLQCGNADASTHAQCVAPTPGAPCTPSTCADLGIVCGEAPNGCGGITSSCGQCTGNTSCKNGVCVPTCASATCSEMGAECGYVADGCGGIIDCGVCPNGMTCGGNGRPYRCVGRPPF